MPGRNEAIALTKCLLTIYLQVTLLVPNGHVQRTVISVHISTATSTL